MVRIPINLQGALFLKLHVSDNAESSHLYTVKVADDYTMSQASLKAKIYTIVYVVAKY